MRNRTLLLICMFFLALDTAATQQIGDVLVADGVEHRILEEPLSELYEESELQRRVEPTGRCSANWRGYIAKWGIQKGILHLLAVKTNICGGGGNLVPADRLFSGSSYPIEAYWITGRLTALTDKNWGEREVLENGNIRVHKYRYEQRVFEFKNGSFVRSFHEIIFPETFR